MSKASKKNTPPIPMFRKLMDTTPNITRSDLAEYLGVSSVAIGQYYNGDALPSMDNLIKIAQYFNVSTDYLLGLTDVKSTDADLKRTCEYTGLSEDIVRDFANFKKAKRKNNGELENSIDDYLEWNIMCGTFMDIVSSLTHLIQLKALFLAAFEEYNLDDVGDDIPTFLTEFYIDEDSNLRGAITNAYIQVCQRLNLHKLDIYNEFSHIIDDCAENIRSNINAENYKDLKTHNFDRLYSKYITEFLHHERSVDDGKHKED